VALARTILVVLQIYYNTIAFILLLY